MIPDYQHEQNIREKTRLEGLGFAFEVNSESHFVYLHGEGIGGGRVMRSCYKPKRRAASSVRADYRDHLASAVRMAQRRIAA